MVWFKIIAYYCATGTITQLTAFSQRWFSYGQKSTLEFNIAYFLKNIYTIIEKSVSVLIIVKNIIFYNKIQLVISVDI
ncbi:hypothetical protein HMPREF3291_03130 [Bacillus sp. HMSC76G11]|nr:hypothetical protein HMPREF3291_03130 [Bacillus sp. HMSC76G11]